jgi:hypothetical protein
MKPLLVTLAALGVIGGGAYLFSRRGHVSLSGSRRRSRRSRRGLSGPHETRELQLYCENDGDLYRQQVQPIVKNLEKKIKKGVFDRAKAEKLWGYLAESCAKKYAKEFGSSDQPWHKMFSMSDRRAVAKAFNDDFMAERNLS